MPIEATFYAIGFLSCLLLIAIIVEVNDRDRKAKKRLRHRHTHLVEPTVERKQEDFNIDVEIH